MTDFLLLHFGNWTLFVFNLADAALTLGPVLLLLVYLWPAKERRLTPVAGDVRVVISMREVRDAPFRRSRPAPPA